ncbi:hypothetical protein GGI02_002423 [Coemansia sp. RSA 2322]|nr:hypothetical protein GGI02_002423 [Coemansia sp. RSA 2322]
MREITGELELVLPQNADTVIPELVFRLPPCSNLELANIASNVVNLIDVATISGCVSVEDVDVGRMRVAIGDGHIRASGIAVSHGSAEFIAMTGSIQVHDCAVPGGNIRVNSPGAMLKMENISAHKILIQSSQATTCIYNAEADFVSVESDSGLLTLNNIAARVLKVKADTSPVTGSWIIGESIDIAVVSAIIQGKLAFRGDSVRAYIGTTEWPVRLAISENYSGSFDISAVNSVVNFCLADAALNEGQTRRRGAVGEGTHMLHVESSNAPIVITTH